MDWQRTTTSFFIALHSLPREQRGSRGQTQLRHKHCQNEICMCETGANLSNCHNLNEFNVKCGVEILTKSG